MIDLIICSSRGPIERRRRLTELYSLQPLRFLHNGRFDRMFSICSLGAVAMLYVFQVNEGKITRIPYLEVIMCMCERLYLTLSDHEEKFRSGDSSIYRSWKAMLPHSTTCLNKCKMASEPIIPCLDKNSRIILVLAIRHHDKHRSDSQFQPHSFQRHTPEKEPFSPGELYFTISMLISPSQSFCRLLRRT